MRLVRRIAHDLEASTVLAVDRQLTGITRYGRFSTRLVASFTRGSNDDTDDRDHRDRPEYVLGGDRAALAPSRSQAGAEAVVGPQQHEPILP